MSALWEEYEMAGRANLAALARLPKGYKHFLNNNAALKDGAESSDFVIKSGRREFKVHTYVIAQHCDTSENVFNPGFKESVDKIWDWTDKDEPDEIEAESEAAEKIVNYFYRFQYDADPYDLKIHARVYAFADSHFMYDLKRYAEEQFEDSASRLLRMVLDYPSTWYNGPFWHQLPEPTSNAPAGQLNFLNMRMYTTQPFIQRPVSAAPLAYIDGASSTSQIKDRDIDASAFFDVVPFVYKKSVEYRGLRRSVVKIWNSLTAHQKVVLGRDHWPKLLEEVPDLALDLIVGYGDEPVTKTWRDPRPSSVDPLLGGIARSLAM